MSADNNKKLELEVNSTKLLDWLKEHYEVPNAVTGFDISVRTDSVVTVTWHTYLTKK